MIFGKLSSIPLLVDNQAALSTANHPLTTPKSKFVSLREFRIRDYQSDGIVRPAWIPGDYNPADGFTKLLGTTKFKEFVRILGMKDKSIDKDVSIHALKLHFKDKLTSPFNYTCEYFCTPEQEFNLLQKNP